MFRLLFLSLICLVAVPAWAEMPDATEARESDSAFLESASDMNGCSNDEDCGACAVCIGGGCKGLGAIVCQKDGDCAAGQHCQIDPSAACKNACVEATSGCKTDADCPACAGCLDGECKGMGAVQCVKDSECGPDQVCKVEPIACQNLCVPAALCESDGDCPSCTVCASGKCESLGAVACQTNSDCGAGKSCMVDPSGPCNNQCLPPGGCVADANCGTCATCDGGKCLPIAGKCSTDADCAGGKCQVNAAAPCKNACVQAVADVVSTDSGPADTAADTGSVQDNGGKSEVSDAGTVKGVDAGPSKDAGWLSSDAADGDAKASVKEKAEGCGAGVVGGSMGWAWLVLVVLVAMRRRVGEAP